MDIVFDLFKSNMDVVFFIYGTSFLVMGFAILIYPARQSKFEVVDILWLLAGFGIVHGIAEYLDMWTIIKGASWGPGGTMAFLKWLCMTVSFIFLFEFGRRLFGISANSSDGPGAAWRRWISGHVGWQLMTMAVIVVFTLSCLEGDFLNSSGIWVRYLLGFSGSMLAGIGILRDYERNKSIYKSIHMEDSVVTLGAMFIAYGVLSGLVAPKGGVLISPWLNSDAFFNVVHIPVQAFRALCALIISFSTIRLLHIFDAENAERMDNYMDEVKTAKERLDEAHKIARLCSWELDIKSNTFKWAENACPVMKLVPKTNDAGGGAPVSTFDAFLGGIHPDDRELVLSSLKDLIQNNRPFDIEHRIELADGGMGYVHQRAMVYNGGGPVHVTGTVQDITRRKRMEHAVLEKEKKLRTLIESTTDAIVTVDANGVITMWNGAAEKIFGYSKDEAVGRFITTFIPERYREAHEAGMKRMLEDISRGITVSTTEVFGRRKDGSEAPLEISFSMHKVGDDVYFNGIMRDITIRKKVESVISGSFETMRKNLHATISAMAMVVEVKDPYTAGHQRRVSDLARSIAEEMGLGDDRVDAIRMAGSIHDIGKIAVPAEILMRTKELNEYEYGLVKRHPQVGYDMLKPIPFPMPIADIVFQHHEKLDGSGYPQGLKGDDILPEAKVICVADVVEAMISHRPHRPARSIDAAIEEITRNSGVLYDPDAVDACVRLFKEKGYAFRQ
jgi:PAS domain S-box-containing protein